MTEASFTVDVATITSDESRRDNQFRGRIMEVDEFPDGDVHAHRTDRLRRRARRTGTQITATATGDLTLHGVTRPVTFDVPPKTGDDRIGVVGSIPVSCSPTTSIDNPSTSGITTEDNGLLEFVLVFEPA